MNLAGAAAGVLPVWMQTAGALLFCAAFLFLWKRSGIVYFGLWGGAWAAQALAVVMGAPFLAGRHIVWLVFYAFAEFLFAILLLAAARAGFSSTFRNWRAPLMIAAIFPVFLAALYTFEAGKRTEIFSALHASILGALYVYNRTGIRDAGLGGKAFRLALLSVAAVFFLESGAYVYGYTGGAPSGWLPVLRFGMFAGSALNTLMVFAAMAMWIDNQAGHMRELGGELDQVRRESARTIDLDRLTGLLNQSALSKRMDDGTVFAGVAVVCDMDDFKDINDRYGHLTGDEILRNIGHLLRASIRPEDEAFRWGGDEFVVLFHNQAQMVAASRMKTIAAHLREFRVRGHGALPISFSWGTAEAAGRSLREVVDEADRNMYAVKRSKR
jgi:diguanylate cyclase (GGDEF)-like protein